MDFRRRRFLADLASLAAAGAGACGLPAHAAMGPDDKFDLVVKGGQVLDPSQKLRGRRDVGIRFGLVEQVAENIPAERARRVLDASGRLVVPGLIDLHAHTFPYGSAIGIPADELGHLFESFHRASNVGSIQGTGLGLAIVKQSVEAHGGSIRVRSQVDHGTCFTVLL